MRKPVVSIMPCGCKVYVYKKRIVIVQCDSCETEKQMINYLKIRK